MAQENAPDWERMLKALAVEADRGYEDLVGKQYQFSEFLSLSFGTAPTGLTPHRRRRWQEFAAEFAEYRTKNRQQRQELVTEARRFLRGLQEEQKRPTQERSPQSTPAKAPNVSNLTASAGERIVDLDQRVHMLPGITRSQGEVLERLGLATARDVLFYYPRDHVDYARQIDINCVQPGETVTVVGKIKECKCFTSPRNSKLSISQLTIRDRTGQMKLNRFFAGAKFANRGWQERHKRQYPTGAIVAASGLVKKNKYGTTLENPEIEVLSHPGESIDSVKVGRILPVYPLTEGVSADVVRAAVVGALPAVKQLRDPLPRALRSEYSLLGLQEAIANIHFPETQEMLAHARRRLVFDEFFFLQLGLLQRRQYQQAKQTSVILSPTGELIDRFKALLPFDLTGAQKRVISDILRDLQADKPMNRLVQGDVGSGKTIVAVFAILAAIQSQYQAALMAPTEVLAEQHYRKLVTWFNQLYIPVELLTGSTRTAKRREIHSQLATGELPLLVGTHALIEDPVQFQRLGLVVIDEQHRFGVEQRARLLSKGESPHVLTMTATPIPRTLALTLHGDLDVSQIDELPPGRQTIETSILFSRDRPKAYELIRREIAQGRQAYIVLPLVEESEKLDVRSAVEEHQRLQEQVFQDLAVGLLHGRLSSAEKDEVLTAFRDNRLQIIVSTTVIEVGVDVPNATVMAIENAERFGLSQLHQLRGRVGRGQHKSYCLLINGGKGEGAMQRLSVLRDSQDGFFISEMDMRLRGPGEVLGRRQSGLPDFALASLVEDQEVLVVARDAAEKLMLSDRTLQDFPRLRSELDLRYRKMTGGSILT